MAESPKTMTVKLDLDSEALREHVIQLLFQYSEWLDSEGLVRSPDESDGDERSYDALVHEFLER